MYPYLLQLRSVFLKDLRGLKDLWDMDLYPQSLWGQNPPWEPCQQQTQLITFTGHCDFSLEPPPQPHPPFSAWNTQSPLCQLEWSSALSLTVSGYQIKSVFTAQTNSCLYLWIPNDSAVVLLCLLVGILLKMRAFPSPPSLCFSVSSDAKIRLYPMCTFFVNFGAQLASRSSVKLTPVSLWHVSHHFLSTSLPSGPRYSRIILH